MPYPALVRAVIDHHKAKGELVDFWVMKGGAIVGSYRVRPAVGDHPWQDLLPTGTSGPRYQQILQTLAPVLYPGEELTLKALERTNGEVLLVVDLPD